MHEIWYACFLGDPERFKKVFSQKLFTGNEPFTYFKIADSAPLLLAIDSKDYYIT